MPHIFSRHLFPKGPVLFLVLAASTHLPCLAQSGSTVVALRVNNQPVSQAKVLVFPPGKGANKTLLSRSDKLLPDTRLSIPPGTTIALQSPGGQQVLRSATPGKWMDYKLAITAGGETHTVSGVGAQIENTVKKTLGYSYRNTNDRGTTAASKGTQFTFTDWSEKDREKAAIHTAEGAIRITDLVPCTVNGKPLETGRHGLPTTKAVSRSQAAGEGTFTSSDQPIDYGNYNRALSYLQAEIAQAAGAADPEAVAADRMCLGEVYMAVERPADAAKQFEAAADYYSQEYGEDDLFTLDARLSQAEALLAAGHAARGKAILDDAIDLLESLLANAEEDLAFVQEDDDTEGEDQLCEEIGDLCDHLAWAYALAGDEAKSNDYYKRAGTPCDE